jgi:hypothetical protein
MAKNSTPATQQYERIVALCRQSEPVCETWLLSDRESNYLKLRVMSGSALVYESHDLRVGDLEKSRKMSCGACLSTCRLGASVVPRRDQMRRSKPRQVYKPSHICLSKIRQQPR